MRPSVMQSSEKLVFFDLETGGLNPKRHPIIQLAAVATDQGLTELESLELKVRFDEVSVAKGRLQKSNYSRRCWAREAIDPSDAAKTLARFLRRHATVEQFCQNGSTRTVAQLVAHNASFDGPFLHSWFEGLAIYCPARFQVLCTLERAMWYFVENRHLPSPDNLRLQTLCRYFSVPLHPHETHDALADVRATIGLYRAILQNGAPAIIKPQPPIQLRRTA